MIVHEYFTLGKGLGYGPLALGTKLLAFLAHITSRKVDFRARTRDP